MTAIAAPENNRMLIVDDEPSALFALRNFFSQNSDFEIYEANNGRDGLALARSYLPRVIITDILMPKMNGFALIRELRQDLRTRSIYVLVYTVMGGDDAKHREILKLGADMCLDKKALENVTFVPPETSLKVLGTYVENRDARFRHLTSSGLEGRRFDIDIQSHIPVISGKWRHDIVGLRRRLYHILVNEPNRVWSSRELADALYQADVYVKGADEANAAKTVERLRNLIEPNPSQPRYLVTHSKRYYELINPLEEPES